jgi:O-antigen/teichoic acid export membrane protein
MQLKQKVMIGLAWSAGSRFLAQLVTWGITIIVIRLLSPADYGLMSLSMVFVGFLTLLSEMGLGAAIVQRKELHDDILRSLFMLILAASGFFYLLLVLLAPLIADFYDEQRLISLVRFLALQFLVLGFGIIPHSLLLRSMKFRQIALIDLVSAIAGSVVTLVSALKGHGVWALVWGAITVRLVSVVGLNIAQPFLRMPRIEMKGVWDFFSFGAYVILSKISWYLFSRVDVLIIGKILGKELLGFYSIGLLLATLPMEKVSGLINRVAFPAFSSMQTEPELAGRHFIKAVRVMSFMAFPVLWGISSLSSEIVYVFLGEKWSSAILPMQIITLIIPIRMISNLLPPAVLGKGHPEVAFRNSFFALVVMSGAFLLSTPWGLLGASLAWVLAFPLVFLWNLYRVVVVLEVSFVEVFYNMRKPFFAGLVMYFGIFILRQSPWLDIGLLPKMIVLIVFGAVLYLGMVFLFNRRGLFEVRDLIRI